MPDMVRVHPPEDSELLAWLARWDSYPAILPRWPASDKLLVILVTEQGEAWHLETREEADRELTVHRRQLCFTVPRAIIAGND